MSSSKSMGMNMQMVPLCCHNRFSSPVIPSNVLLLSANPKFLGQMRYEIVKHDASFQKTHFFSTVQCVLHHSLHIVHSNHKLMHSWLTTESNFMNLPTNSSTKGSLELNSSIQFVLLLMTVYEDCMAECFILCTSLQWGRLIQLTPGNRRGVYILLAMQCISTSNNLQQTFYQDAEQTYTNCRPLPGAQKMYTHFSMKSICIKAVLIDLLDINGQIIIKIGSHVSVVV